PTSACLRNKPLPHPARHLGRCFIREGRALTDWMVEQDGFEPPVPLVSGASGRFLPVSVLCQRRSARLNRSGERLASDSDQSDVYVCPAKERAGMKRNRSRSGTRSLTDELAELRRLDPTALRQGWRVVYRTEAPVHIGQSLLL